MLGCERRNRSGARRQAHHPVIGDLALSAIYVEHSLHLCLALAGSWSLLESEEQKDGTHTDAKTVRYQQLESCERLCEN
jgi:hypothetical protein